MKASKLLKIIREELKDYPIDYLKNKVTDDRYKDPLTKKLAKYNSQVYDEIYSYELSEDFEISDREIKDIKNDINYYFEKYIPSDLENKEFTKYISLYLALIVKKPLHPFSDDKNDERYILNDSYYCRERIKSLHVNKSLCRYCICENVGYMDLF